MRFALIGDHADGRAFAAAAVASGQHDVIVYCGADADFVRTLHSPARVTADLEEVLADPQVEACIVAAPIGKRLDVARRVLQSERHALVVHPVDLKPDGAYELNMLQGDVHRVLLPLLPEAMTDRLPVGVSSLVELTVTDPNDPLLAIDDLRRHPAFAGWTLLRRLGGEIAEVSAFAVGEEADSGGNTLMCGRFETGSLFRARFGRAIASRARTALLITPEHSMPIDISHIADQSRIVTVFENAVRRLADQTRAEPAAGPADSTDQPLSWRDEIRAAELNDAAARSLAKRRTSLMDYQEANEDVGFKGTMTLVGCGMIWLAMLLLVLSAWKPWLGWLILPAMIAFLGLQLLRWVK